jgi:hypothetical protein
MALPRGTRKCFDERDAARLNQDAAKLSGFVSPGGGRLPLGVWQRFNFAHGSPLKPIMLFVDGAVYRAIYDFSYAAQIAVEREFGPALRVALRLS